MKIIKRMIQVTILAAVLLIVQDVQAQRGPHHRSGQMLEKMKTELNLTAEQEVQITAIQEKYKPQMKALKTQDFEDVSEKRTAFKALVNAQKEEISQVLTEEQKATIKAKKEARKEHHKAKKGERKAMHEAMKAYKETNIHPVMLKQRTKLEQNISAEDKAKIAELRKVFKELKESKKGHKKEFSKRNAEGDEQNKHAMMQQRKAKKEAVKAQYKKEFEALKALNEKYDRQIKALHKEIELQQAQWKKEMKAIRDGYAPKHEEMKQQEGERKHHKGDKKGHHKGKMGRHDMAKKHFLLLDPNESPTTTSINTQAATSLKTFPNPAVNNSRLVYEVKTATRIKIVLTDESGNVIKVLVNEFKEVGTHQMDVDLSQLKNGAYYYTVTDNGGISSAKVVVNK